MAREIGLTRAEVSTRYITGLRESLPYLIHHGVPAVQTALSDTLQRGTVPTHGEAKVHRNYILKQVTEGPVYGSPSWLDHNGLMAVTFELSSPAFWVQMLKPGLLPDPVREKVETGFDSQRDTSQLISGTNAYFMSSAIYVSLLAVAEGEAVRKRRFDPRIFPLVQELSTRFPVGAADPKELIARMQELVPNPDVLTTAAEPTLIDYFKDLHVFKRKSDTGIVSCPAIPFTGIVMDQWGRMFDDVFYRVRFADMVEKPGNNPSVLIWSKKGKKK